LRNTTRSGKDASELELAEKVVVPCVRTLIVDLDESGRLVIGGSREDLTLLGGGGSIAGDELGEDSSRGLNTERG
jgi:hypothetical protein